VDHPTRHGRSDDDLSISPISPLGYVGIAEIEDEMGHAAGDSLHHCPDCFAQDDSWDLQSRILLEVAFRFEQFVMIPSDEGIQPPPDDNLAALSGTVTHDFHPC
jgi:hypothetical protein